MEIVIGSRILSPPYGDFHDSPFILLMLDGFLGLLPYIPDRVQIWNQAGQLQNVNIIINELILHYVDWIFRIIFLLEDQTLAKKNFSSILLVDFSWFFYILFLFRNVIHFYKVDCPLAEERPH